MPITMSCPSCGKNLSAPDSSSGKKAKCPACGQIMIVPDVAQNAGEPGGAAQPPTPFSPEPAVAPDQNWLDNLQGPEAPSASAGLGDEARRPCPQCGEMIMAGAAKCRFCNAIFDPQLKLKAAKKYGPDDENLSGGEWAFCILCAGIACIVGIVYAIQGKPKGMKMVGISFAAAVVWNILNVLLQLATQGPHNFR